MSPLYRAQNERPVILIFARYYLPGFRAGGPVQSIANLVKALHYEYDFRIICLNRDLGERETYSGIVPSQWAKLDGVNIYYATNAEIGFSLCWKIVREVKPDMIYLNSLLDRQFSMLPYLVARIGFSIPILLAPRGELSPGALKLKALRKRIFFSIVNVIKYYKYVHWHASSLREKEQICEMFDPEKNHVFLASNLPGVQPEDLPRTHHKKPGELKIVLVGRISPVKNTLIAIKIAAQLKCEVQFDLWGPLEDKKYWRVCHQQIERCPANIKVEYRGEFEHKELQTILKEYDVLLLPTLGENFGHSILEALAAGLPVVISDQTPWRNLENAGIGADLSLENMMEFVVHLERFSEMNEAGIETARINCKRYFQEWWQNHADIMPYKEMIERVIDSKKKYIFS